MGVQEFEDMFDTIDTSRTGFISVEQLHEFCEVIYETRLCLEHVTGAVKLVSPGASNRVARRDFLHILTDIERRKTTEEQAYWDFQSLDYLGTNRISLRDTLLLFRQIHGEKFSLSTWKRFLASRESQWKDVYFDEIRFWLCSPPIGSPSSDKDFKEEENNMVMRQAAFSLEEVDSLRTAIEDEYSIQKEKEDLEEDTCHHARRKLRKWNYQGVEAMLFDDGLDVEDGQRRIRSKRHVTTNDLNELLEIKYESMCEKLMQQMATQAAVVADEAPELLQQIRRHWKQLIKEGDQYDGSLPGGHMTMLASLTGLMGELRLYDREHRKQMEVLKTKLKNEGKTPQQISSAVQARYQQIITGDPTCAGLLLQLHKRHQQEREGMMQTLKMDSRQPLKQAIPAEYCRLMKQILVVDEEPEFVAMATAVGLSERAMDMRPERSDWDRSRSERLAQLRLERSVGQSQQRSSPGDVPDLKELEAGKLMDLQLEVVREMTRKHFYEREALMHMLLKPTGKVNLEKARKLGPDQRRHQLKVLQNQHTNWKSNPRADLIILHNIFEEALWLRHEERRGELEASIKAGTLSPEVMREIMLADLQQRQGTDFEGVVQDMQLMKKDEVLVILKKELQTRVEEVYDNIAAMLLGGQDITPEDEEYIKVLDEKYNLLRKRIFVMALKDKLDWKNFSKEEKLHALRELMKEERMLRSEGKLQDMANIVGHRVKMLPPLQSMMGDDKATYEQKLNMQKLDEDEVNDSHVTNVLAELVPRYDNEQEFLLTWLHSPEAKGLTLRQRRMRIVEIKLETCRVEMEEDTEIAAVSVGLMERVRETLTHRNKRDMNRQSQLARKRVQQRGQRLRDNEVYRKEPEIKRNNLPKKGDITGLQTVYLHEMLKRHSDERETTLNFLQDESIDDLVEVAANMLENDRQQRLTELQAKRHNLNLTLPEDQDEHSSILEEAAALRAVAMRQQLVAMGNTANVEAIAVAILTELQEEQDKEVALTLNQLDNMNEEDIETCLHREINNRSLGTAWNVITVLTRYQGEATDDALFKALEGKYYDLRQRLFAESLRVRIGSDKWYSMTTVEKQQRQNSLETQYQEQLHVGRVQETLLGDNFVLQEAIAQLMGVCPHVFRNKVKGQIVTGNLSNFHMEEEQGAISKKGDHANILKDLLTRFEEEKLALNRQLKGHSEEFFSESERLTQLVCYHREGILANQQSAFTMAAILVGLVERQQEEIKFRLSKDRERYGRLADVVMKEAEKGVVEEIPVDQMSAGSFVTLMDGLVCCLENKHVQERHLFHRLLSSSGKAGEVTQQASMCSSQQRVDKLMELKEARKQSLAGRKCENLEILTEATVYKLEDRRGHLTLNGDGITDLDLRRSLIADLLEQQNSEALRIIKHLTKASETEILENQDKILQDKRSNMADNVAMVIFSAETADSEAESDILQALKGKYDALKDKLLAEALMKELGESEWNRLSEAERQRKIFELKLKERQLRKEGKVDEANALLAKLLQDQEQLRKLMGDAAQDQRDRLQERLKRRRERLAQGLSQEEVDQLEKEDIEREEEEEKNKRRNVLDDLDHRFEQERDEIMRRLQDAGDNADKERERQANLARLHRDERLARQQGNFGEAALLLGLSERRDEDLRLKKGEERDRQEMLARERLEAARQRRKGKKSGKEEDEGPLPLVDMEDPSSLQESIAHNLDRRHKREMNLFMKLLEDDVAGRHRKLAQDMSTDDRDDKLFELRELHKNWDNSEDRDEKEQLALFKEVIGYLSEVVKGHLEDEGKSSSNDDIQVALLADLQELQKRESHRLLTDMESKNLDTLKELHEAMLSLLKKYSNHDNIAAVLLGNRSRSDSEHGGGEEEEEEEDAESGDTSKKDIVKALEQKYDAIKDKLLIEALMKELGEKEWATMTEKERQKKLIELKLKERRLRREGKFDEISNIIGSHLENEKLLDELLVDSRKSQREKLEERLARRKQVIAERQAEGLSTDDNTIDDIIQVEEEQEARRKRRNILEELNRNFDDERDALLRTLSFQKDKVKQERERQIALAKLKRQERQMKKGEKLDTVAMIISNAKEDKKRREDLIAADQERQKNVARERLEARRRKKNNSVMSNREIEEKLAEEEDQSKVEDAMMTVEGHHLPEVILSINEGKQEEELNMLMTLLELSKSDQSASSKEDADLKSELTRLQQEVLRWRKSSAQKLQESERNDSPQQNQGSHLHQVASNRTELQEILAQALVCRLEVEKRLMRSRHPEMTGDTMTNEVQVAMVTDLQVKQTSESAAVQKIIETQDDSMLQEVKKTQHLAQREGWFDNLTGTIFSMWHGNAHDAHVEEIEASFQAALTQMEQEFEQQKIEAIRKAREDAAEGETVDEEAIIKGLQEQYDVNRQKVTEEMSAEKAAMLNQQEMQQLSRDQKDYEDQAARSIIKLATDHMTSGKKGQESDSNSQALLMQQRLLERREARRMARDVRDAYERETTLDLDERETTPSSRTRSRTIDSATPPMGGLRREATKIDADVSDEQKQALLNQMVQQQKNLQSKITEQQRKQEEMLKRRIEARKGKQKSEAAELLSLGQRQKTILESAKQDEKDRQLQKMKERVHGVRERREPSPGKSKWKDTSSNSTQ